MRFNAIALVLFVLAGVAIGMPAPAQNLFVTKKPSEGQMPDTTDIQTNGEGSSQPKSRNYLFVPKNSKTSTKKRPFKSSRYRERKGAQSITNALSSVKDLDLDLLRMTDRQPSSPREFLDLMVATQTSQITHATEISNFVQEAAVAIMSDNMSKMDEALKSQLKGSDVSGIILETMEGLDIETLEKEEALDRRNVAEKFDTRIADVLAVSQGEQKLKSAASSRNEERIIRNARGRYKPSAITGSGYNDRTGSTYVSDASIPRGLAVRNRLDARKNPKKRSLKKAGASVFTPPPRNSGSAISGQSSSAQQSLNKDKTQKQKTPVYILPK